MQNQLMNILNLLSNLDYGLLIQYFKPLISFFVAHKVASTYTLHRDFKPKDISKVNIPPELKQKYTKLDISQIASKKLKEATLEFANLMIETFPSDCLINFYNNINEAKIKRDISVLLLSSSGVFSVKSNKIRVCTISSIYHELFHMASSTYDDNLKLSYSGFKQYSYDKKSNIRSIGMGINEGYTELLTQRYFGQKYKIPKTYLCEIEIVDKLEKIIGQKKMENLYLTANLPGLISELMKYASEDEIAKFISGVDLIWRHSDDIFIFRNEKLKKSIVNVYEFLLKTYMVKLKQQLNNKIISINEFIEQYIQFAQSLGTNIKVGGHKYDFLSVDILLENLQSIIDVSELSANTKNIDSSFKR